MKLFVSYSHKDKDLSESLTGILRSGGIEVWKDVERLRIGQRWQDELRKAIEFSDGIVLALTPNWIESHYCRWEFVTAIENGKDVFPVLLSPVDKLPDTISEIHYADLTLDLNDVSKQEKLLNDLLAAKIKISKAKIDSQEKISAELAINQEHQKQQTQQLIHIRNITDSKVSIIQTTGTSSLSQK